MPVAFEHRLMMEAKQKKVKDKDAYVYGTMRRMGWVPAKPGVASSKPKDKKKL